MSEEEGQLRSGSATNNFVASERWALGLPWRCFRCRDGKRLLAPRSG